MISTQYINLNMIPSGIMPVLYCSQYDIGRPLGMVVYNGGEAVNLDSYTCTIEATRTDGKAITAAVTTDGSIGAFETTATMTNKADHYPAKLVLFDSNSRRVASLAFIMVVTPKTMDENAESIEEDASLYQQYTGTVQSLIANIREDIADINTHISDMYFNTCLEMKASTTLKSGMICQTAGYYAVNDGGGALYKLSNSGTANGLDIIACANGLIATLITPPHGNPLIYGAYGDDTHDDYNAIVRCIDQHDYVAFPADRTYLVASTLTIGEGKTLEGYGAVIHSTADPAVLVKNYESAEVHSALPIYITGLAFKGDNTNTLLSLQNALKVSVVDTRYYDFAVAFRQTTGYELYVQNFRAVGNNATAIGMLLSSGDCSINNVVMRDVHTAIKLLTGPGRYTFNYVHCWILNPDYFEDSCMFDTAIYGGRDCICNDFYFDTYHKPIIKRGLCFDIFNSPVNTYLASVATNAGVTSGTFITFVEDTSLFRKELYNGKIEINKYIEKIQTTPFYTLTNDDTIKFKLSFGTAFATTVDAFTAQMQNNLFTLANGVLLYAGKIELTPDFVVINGRVVLPAGHAPTAENPTIKFNEKIYFTGETAFVISRALNTFATLYARLNYIRITADNPNVENTYFIDVALPYNFVN